MNIIITLSLLVVSMSDQAVMDSIVEEPQVESEILGDDCSLGVREFHVLDEIDSTNKDSGESDSSSYNEVDTDSESEIPEDEIDAMLDEGNNFIIIYVKLPNMLQF